MQPNKFIILFRINRQLKASLEKPLFGIKQIFNFSYKIFLNTLKINQHD